MFLSNLSISSTVFSPTIKHIVNYIFEGMRWLTESSKYYNTKQLILFRKLKTGKIDP